MVAPLPRKVLIVRLGAIGDVTNALVVASALEAHRPDVEIGWAVHELARPLVEAHPSVERVHPWPRAAGLRGLRRLLRSVRAAGYEVALDMQRIQKSALVARLSGAPRVVGFDRRRAKEGSWLWTREHLRPRDPGAHMVEHYLDFARHLGVPDPAVRRILPRDAEAEAWADRWVQELGEPPLVCCLGASKPRNRWAPERFAALVEALAGEALPVALVGGPADRELFAPTLAALEGRTAVRDLVGRTSLLELVALLRRARLFVGCDTGPMHLAAAVETPVVALFGPADPRRTGPWGEGHRVVRPPERTMEALALEAVLEAVTAGLAERSAS